MDYDSQFTELEYLLELKEIDRHQPMTEEIQYIDVSVYENPNILAKEKEQIFNKFPLMAYNTPRKLDQKIVANKIE